VGKSNVKDAGIHTPDRIRIESRHGKGIREKPELIADVALEHGEVRRPEPLRQDYQQKRGERRKADDRVIPRPRTAANIPVSQEHAGPSQP
jgi:hypothetical protein